MAVTVYGIRFSSAASADQRPSPFSSTSSPIFLSRPSSSSASANSSDSSERTIEPASQTCATLARSTSG
ncbi:MAG: hypothetical protein Q8Q11_04270 [bacterium]|nr:hypothetical protein [bacterium]